MIIRAFADRVQQFARPAEGFLFRQQAIFGIDAAVFTQWAAQRVAAGIVGSVGKLTGWIAAFALVLHGLLAHFLAKLLNAIPKRIHCIGLSIQCTGKVAVLEIVPCRAHAAFGVVK